MLVGPAQAKYKLLISCHQVRWMISKLDLMVFFSKFLGQLHNQNNIKGLFRLEGFCW